MDTYTKRHKEEALKRLTHLKSPTIIIKNLKNIFS